MSDLREGEDYYLDETGLLVFTASYHLKRGYCCGNGCRHCPYGSEAPPLSSSISFRDIQLDTIDDFHWMAKWDADPAIRHLILPFQNAEQYSRLETAQELWQRAQAARDAGTEEKVRRRMVLVDGKVAGTGSFMMDPAHKITPEDGTAWFGIVIGEEWARGRGLGTGILQELETMAIEAGARQAEAGVFEFNQPSLRLFGKSGYREIARIFDFTFWDGRSWADVRFRKSLV